MMQHQLKSYQATFLYLIAMAISVALTIFAVHNQTTINGDGLCYVLSAEQFEQFGLKQAMHFCVQASWPLYSVLLSITSHLTTFSLEQSAVLLNAFCDAMTVMLFVMILRQLNAKPRVVLLGLLTILCAHDFNSVRDNIVRDHGYWMFYLASLYFMLRYVKEERVSFIAAWSASILAASLFRIEGLIFFFLLPITMLFLPGKMSERVKRTASFYLPHVAIAAIGLILAFFFADHIAQYSGRLPGAIDKIQHSFSLVATRFQMAKANIIQHVLSVEAVRDATLVTLLLLVLWYLITVISQFSWLYSGLFCLAQRARLQIATQKEWVVLMAYLIVNLIITISFFAIYFFLSKRYLMAQSFILMLFVPYALNYIIEKKNLSYKKSLLIAMVSWMVLSNSHLIYSSNDPHQYLANAGRWMEKFVPSTQSVYANDVFVLYYSGRARSDFFNTFNHYQALGSATPAQLDMFDIVAINTKIPGADKLIAQMNTTKTPLARHFENNKGEQILIYNKHLKERPLT